MSDAPSIGMTRLREFRCKGGCTALSGSGGISWVTGQVLRAILLAALSASLGGCMVLGLNTRDATDTVWLMPVPPDSTRAAKARLGLLIVHHGFAGNPHQPFDYPKYFKKEDAELLDLKSLGPRIPGSDVFLGPQALRGELTLNCSTVVIALEVPKYDTKYIGPNYPPIIGWRAYEFNGTYVLRRSSNLELRAIDTPNGCRYESP